MLFTHHHIIDIVFKLRQRIAIRIFAAYIMIIHDKAHIQVANFHNSKNAIVMYSTNVE